VLPWVLGIISREQMHAFGRVELEQVVDGGIGPGKVETGNSVDDEVSMRQGRLSTGELSSHTHNAHLCLDQPGV
jgi:hypothetical protein